jgi:cell division protein FtsN
MPVFYWIQIGSFTDAARAHRAWSAFENIGLGRAEIISSNINGTVHYRVKAGPYTDKALAEETLARIKASSVEYRNSYIVNE